VDGQIVPQDQPVVEPNLPNGQKGQLPI